MGGVSAFGKTHTTIVSLNERPSSVNAARTNAARPLYCLVCPPTPHNVHSCASLNDDPVHSIYCSGSEAASAEDIVDTVAADSMDRSITAHNREHINRSSE